MFNTNRFLHAASSICLVGFIAAGAVSAADIPGEAIVRLGEGYSSAQALLDAGVTILDSVPSEGTYLVSYPTSVTFTDKKADLLSGQMVTAVYPNRGMSLLETHQASISTPDDEVQGYAPGELPVPFVGQPAVYAIGQDSAQLLSRGAGVRIAVIDNGIDRSHPLFDSVSYGNALDVVGRDGDPSEEPGGLYGHGTFVTGLVRLVAPEAELLVIRAFDGDGQSTAFKVAQAIYWATSQGADVINMSFGTTTDHPVLAQACQRAYAAGAVLVASVGNAGLYQPVYPASYPGVIAVSSIDTVDLIAPFSNGNDSTDVCAPGVAVYSALPLPYLWGTWSGTSFSAPIVSGGVGLVEAVRSGMSPASLELHVRSTATRELQWGVLTPPDLFFGFGRIDLYEAVLAFCRGDMNRSNTLEVGDLEIIVETVQTGVAPEGKILRQADVNADGVLDQLDIDMVTDSLFGSSGG